MRDREQLMQVVTCCDYVLPVVFDWTWRHTGHQISPLPNRWWSFILGQWQSSLFDSICSTTSNWICSTTFRGSTGDLDCFFSCQENHFTGWQTLAFSLWQCTVRTLRGTVHRIPLRPCPSMWTTSSRARLYGTRSMEKVYCQKLLPLLSKALYLGTPTTAALVLWFCSSLCKFVYGIILCVILWLRVGLLAFVCIEFILVESKTENRANSSVCPYQKATESN